MLLQSRHSRTGERNTYYIIYHMLTQHVSNSLLGYSILSVIAMVQVMLRNDHVKNTFLHEIK